MRLPSRVLLLTDVVQSTKIAETIGEAGAAQVWSAHDRMARDLLRGHGGREIDRTDGFLMMFETVEPAVRFALDYQYELDRVGMRARIGIHMGEVVLMKNAAHDVELGAKPLEVEGLAKPLAARVSTLATPGQILLSAAARAVLGPISMRVESHGFWRLKGISEPIEIYEIGRPGAPFTPPPDQPKAYRVVREGEVWLPRREVPRSLPGERDSFVGRGGDLVALAQLLDDGARLVSVLGIGGTGKTRLATRFGWLWLGEYPGGTYFCDLSESRSLQHVAYSVAQALDVQLGAGNPIEQLGHAIAGRGDCLVILDNFEQITALAGETVGCWLDRAPDARFVVTTRERMGLSGESVLSLAPLPKDDGVALFVERAQQADKDFRLLDADRPALAELVALLDSLPLAIELAAARVTLMGPAALLERMGQRFKILAGSKSRPSRQATLRGALDWSWDLLNDEERSALAQLSIFEGGFTLEAAEAVLQLSEMWPMDAVQSLIDKSLVRVLGISPRRMDLMVSVQAYASEKLDDRPGAEKRHGDWCATMGNQAFIAALGRFGGVARRRALAAELDNLLAACRRAEARGDAAVALSCLNPMSKILLVRGPAPALVEWARRIGDMPGLSPMELAWAHVRLADGLMLSGGRGEARDLFEASLAVFREHGDRYAAMRALAKVGRTRMEMRDYARAEEQLFESLQISRELGDRANEALALGQLGVVYDLTQRDEVAIEALTETIAILRETGDRMAEGSAVSNLGMLHVDRRRFKEGRELLEQGLAVHREVGNRRSEGVVLTALGGLAKDEGRLADAQELYEAGIALHRQLGNRGAEGAAVSNLGVIYEREGRLEDAERCYELGLAAHREAGHRYNECNVMNTLSLLYSRTGRRHESRELLVKALAIAIEIDAPDKIAIVRANLAQIDPNQGADPG